MIRLGLCCLFVKEPIRFRVATAAFLARLEKRGGDPVAYLDEIVLSNVDALTRAVLYCSEKGIGAFRVNSHILPLATHPEWKYEIADLPSGEKIAQGLEECRLLAQKRDVRLTLHPDQFVVLNAIDEKVRASSVEELVHQAGIAQRIGADVINIHGGGGYGDKGKSLERLKGVVGELPEEVKRRLTLENDEKVFSPEDLVPLCRDVGLPFVYDVHHHRCLPDGWSVEEATQRALTTWDREPLFHISSPLEGWKGAKPFRHHDYISIGDVPACWQGILKLTIEVEAKAKERAVLKLKRDLRERGWDV